MCVNTNITIKTSKNGEKIFDRKGFLVDEYTLMLNQFGEMYRNGVIVSYYCNIIRAIIVLTANEAAI